MRLTVITFADFVWFDGKKAYYFCIAPLWALGSSGAPGSCSATLKTKTSLWGCYILWLCLLTHWQFYFNSCCSLSYNGSLSVILLKLDE